MRMLAWVGITFVCFVSGGATCARRDAPLPFPPPPVVFSESPTLEDLIAVVNRTSNVSQLSSNSATVEVLSMPSLPRLTNSTLHLQRDRKFRLRASLPIILGAGMDMGSNDEMFWFEVPEGISKTLYYARHDQYQQQLNRAILPVDPTWVMDALGLVQIDPNTVVAGPVRREDGKLEIRNTLTMPDGVYQRVCFIEPRAGYVTNQFLYAPGGNLVAQSEASNHVYYEQQGCALPHQVELHLAPTVGPPLALKISVAAYTVNQLLSGDPGLFVMPQSASNMVDLTTLSGPPTAPPVAQSAATGGPGLGTGAGVSPATYSPTATTGYRLRGEP